MLRAVDPLLMAQHLTIPLARAAISTRAQLEQDGWRETDVRRGLADGTLIRLQRNRYVDASLRETLWPESQHLLAVVAAAEEMRDGSGVADASAAVAHGLPLYRHRPTRLEMTALDGWRSSSRAGVLRHEEALSDDDVTTVDGIRCTTLERTVFDVARSLSWEASVALADAALRSATVRERVYDEEAAELWRERMRERLARARGMRGVRQAGRVIEFADGRAELPGESVSRVQLVRLGFTDLDLQVPVPSPTGSDYHVDIALRQVKTFWEFDGKGKYLNEAQRAGRSIQDVVLKEKQREDWIRGTTQWRLCRGEDAHIATPDAMAKRLASFGVHPPA
jgi:hypothetical protein